MTLPAGMTPDSGQLDADSEAGRSVAEAPAMQTPYEGELLTEGDEKKVARKIEFFWCADEKAALLRHARAKRAKLWYEGHRNVYLTTDDTGGNPNVYAPPAGTINPPVPNLVARLCRRTTAQLLADPPIPEVTPQTADEQHEAHAELSTRILRAEQSEGGHNWRVKGEGASELAHIYGTVFAYGSVDKQGGGWEPMDIQAHPNAVSEAEPLVDPEPPTIAQPQVDPATGQPMLGPDGQPVQLQVPNPKYKGPAVPLVKKYVMRDGTLSDKATGAKRRWLPKDRYVLLPQTNVRLVPHTVVSGLDEAEGVVMCVPTTIGELKAQFPKVAQMQDEDLRAIAAYVPPRYQDLQRRDKAPGAESQVKQDEQGQIEDSTTAYPLIHYRRACAQYPEGAYIVVAAGKVLHRQPWAETREDGERECLMLPLVACRDFDNPAGGDPMGIGLAEYIGGLDEINAQIWVYTLEYLYRHGNPNTFFMATSPVTAEQMRRRDGTPIEVLSKEDIPINEQVPEPPKMLAALAAEIVQQLYSESGLEQTAQGVASPSVQSGIHAQQVIEQALVALGQMKRNLDDFFCGLWRLALQFRRVYWTQPQRIRYETDDGAYREREWTATDIATARHVRFARGTGTMMGQTAKRIFAREELQIGAITLEDYQQMTAQGNSTTLGYQDNPHRQRVLRQIARWKEGPPPEIAQDPLQLQQAAAMLFAPIPADAGPMAAKVRFLELDRVAASTARDRFPAEWVMGLDQAYEIARQAAGIQTVAEQQAAAQAQAEAEAQQRAEEQDGKREERDAKAAQQQQQGDQKHQQAMERDAAKQDATAAQQQDRLAAQQSIAAMRAPAAAPEPAMAQ